MAKRKTYRWPIRLALFGSAMLYCAGCSTVKPAEPQATAQPQKSAPKAETKQLAKAPVSQRSSLEQMQQGKSVGTPETSPMKDIYFDFDRYDLRPDARATLKANADWLKQNPSAAT